MICRSSLYIVAMNSLSIMYIKKFFSKWNACLLTLFRKPFIIQKEFLNFHIVTSFHFFLYGFCLLCSAQERLCHTQDYFKINILFQFLLMYCCRQSSPGCGIQPFGYLLGMLLGPTPMGNGGQGSKSGQKKKLMCHAGPMAMLASPMGSSGARMALQNFLELG